MIQVPDDRSGLRRDFVEKAKWIGLVDLIAFIPGDDVILVMSAVSDARNERFPNSRLAADLKRMAVLVPAVEIAHHIHLSRARRPKGESSSLHAVFRTR